MKKLLTCFAVLLGSCAENHVASAQGTHAWNDPAGGIYGLANNWTPLGFPSSLDTARFALNEQYTVSFNQSQQAALLQVAFGDVTFRGTGIFSGDRSYTLANADVDDFGRLTLVHNDAQSHSFELLATSLLTVAGEMHITQGTKLTSPLDAEVDGPDINTAGVLRVTGSKAARPSLWEANNVTIGKLNRGLLAIEEGGQAIIDDLTVGAGSGSFGQVDVVGVGSDNSPSTLTVDELEIGDQGNGLLNVTGGAEVNVSGSTVLGFSDGGELFLGGDVAAPRATRLTTNNFGIFIGTATIASRAELFTNQVAVNSTSLLIQQPGAMLTANSDFRISQGEVTVEDGAHLSTVDTMISSSLGPTANKFLRLQTSDANTVPTWTNSGDVFVGGDETSASDVAKLLIAGGIADIGGTVKIWDEGVVQLSTLAPLDQVPTTLIADTVENTLGGQFDFQVGTLAVKQFEGNLVNQGGWLAPGSDDSGATFVTGDYEQQIDAGLALDIGGTAPGVAHDLLTITGLADLRGALQVKLIDGFTPESSDQFDVAVATNLVGFFDNVLNGQRLASADGRGSFLVNYGVGSPFDVNRLVLSDFQSSGMLPGDYNGNGVVDAADYTVWRDHLGAPAGTLPNDLDGGVIGTAQYNTWRLNFGAALAPGPAATIAAVPEPASWLGSVVGVLLLVCSRMVRGR